MVVDSKTSAAPATVRIPSHNVAAPNAMIPRISGGGTPQEEYSRALTEAPVRNASPTLLLRANEMNDARPVRE